MTANRTDASAPAKGSSRKRARSRWRRWVVGLGVPAVVAAAIVVLTVYTQITLTFEGRLWTLPARVYSASLHLAPGQVVDANAIALRLDRTGYARVDAAPARPGQYRKRSGSLDVYVRGFAAGERPVTPVRVLVSFAGGAIASVADERGRRLPSIDLEPELLSLVFGKQQEERMIVPLSESPKNLVNAVLAAEDARFYRHAGIDPFAVVRAAFTNVRSGKIVQGGSTITQQTVKNLYFGQERTWWRKAREALMSVILDARYPKDRILEVYLNEVYLGQRGSVAICGMQAASRYFFGRNVSDLSLAEAATLAGLIRNPGGYNPFTHPDRAVERRDLVLSAMLELGFADKAAVTRAKSEPLRVASGGAGYARAPYVVDFVRGQLAEFYAPQVIAEDGLEIYTTIDTIVQTRAEEALERGLARLETEMPSLRRQRSKRRLQGCVVVLDPRSGAILALVGGRDYQDSLTPASILDDSPLDLVSGGKTWSPANYDGEFLGPISARAALEGSRNVPTARAALAVGLDRVIAAAKSCGFTEKFEPLPSLALGAQEVTPLALATAYGTLATLGRRVPPRILEDVVSRDGRKLGKRLPETLHAVPVEAAYLIDDVLRGVLTRGTAASSAALGFRGDAAGKTGTTDDTRDAWFVGYTPQLLALVWVGYDDNAKTGLTGAVGALPIWVDLMMHVQHRWAGSSFAEPAGIVHEDVDPESGELATEGCPERVEEIFIAGTEPPACSLHQSGFRSWWNKLFRPRARPRI